MWCPTENHNTLNSIPSVLEDENMEMPSFMCILHKFCNIPVNELSI